MYSFNKDEEKKLATIKATPYLEEAMRLLENFVAKQENSKMGYLLAFDEIHHIMKDSEIFVRKYLQNRKDGVESELNMDQAIQKIVGDSFSAITVYIFLQNKILGNIKSNIFITSSPSSIPIIKKEYKKIYRINVDGETQKPDCDLFLFSLKKITTTKKLKKSERIEEKDALDKCLILSLKTSLRERAGQTYRWKLLLEIARLDHPIKDKYNISYESDITPLVCFATTDFHAEIGKPQQRGMFKFFDKAFIAKNIDEDFISRMSSLPKYINEVL